MIANRIYLGEQASGKLRSLQQRTRMTPNLLCRIGLCISLEDDRPIDLEMHNDGKAREFNMPTLLGDYQELFLALLRERVATTDRQDEDRLTDHLRAHISRGVTVLSLQTKQVEDLSTFVHVAQRATDTEAGQE